MGGGGLWFGRLVDGVIGCVTCEQVHEVADDVRLWSERRVCTFGWSRGCVEAVVEVVGCERGGRWVGVGVCEGMSGSHGLCRLWKAWKCKKSRVTG